MSGDIKINQWVIFLIIVIAGSVSIADAEIFKTGPYPGNSFVDPAAVIDAGSFSIGSESYIAPFTSLTGESIEIGSYCDFQDSSSTSGKIIIKDYAVIAHGADLVGNVEIGSRAFIGFNDLIQDAKIGDGAYIGIGSKVIGVDIPANKAVPNGVVIDSIDEVEKLKPVTKAQQDFVAEVIDVNRALATGYTKIWESKGSDAFGKTGPHGDGDILINGIDVLEYSGFHEPVIGAGTVIGNSRVIGQVILRNNIMVGDRTSIRGDEGVPIDIGDNAQIGKNNTFHSLNGQKIMIARNFKLGDDSVVHGPLNVGENLQVGNRVIIHKSKIGKNSIIGDNAVLVGVRLLDGAIIPPNTVLDKQRDANLFNYATQKYKESTTPASIFQLAIASLIPVGFGLIGSMILGKK